MWSAEHWQNGEGSNRINIQKAIEILLKKSKKSIKGRTLNDELLDLLLTALKELLVIMHIAGRQVFDGETIDEEFFHQLERQFNRVQDRVYKSRERRPKVGQLVHHPTSSPSESAQQQDLAEEKEWVMHAINQLPPELRKVILFELKRMGWEKRGMSAAEFQAALGMGETNYNERLKRAIARLIAILRDEEAL